MKIHTLLILLLGCYTLCTAQTDTPCPEGTLQVEVAASATEVCEGTPIYFTATTNSDSITHWHWDYGDGNYSVLPDSSVAVFNHYMFEFPDPNIIAVNLTITDINDCTTSAIVLVEVHQNNLHHRIATDTFLCAEQILTLHTVSDNHTGYSTSPISWQWSTGDTASFIRTNRAGTYSVQMRDEHGCIAADEKVVEFSEISIPEITAESIENAFVRLKAKDSLYPTKCIWYIYNKKGKLIDQKTENYIELRGKNKIRKIKIQLEIQQSQAGKQTSCAKSEIIAVSSLMKFEK
jgi:hypothetical protein